MLCPYWKTCLWLRTVMLLSTGVGAFAAAVCHAQGGDDLNEASRPAIFSEQAVFEALPVPEEGTALLTGAVVPATPAAPGQGPWMEDLGPEWEEQRVDLPRPFWNARSLSSGWIPRGSSDGFGITDVMLTTSFAPIYFDDLPALLITPGFGFHFWEPPAALELPSRVFDAYVDVSWRLPLTERLGFSAGVTPGVYGDFARENPQAFQLTGWGLLDLTLGDRWTLVGGAAVVRQLDLAVLPVGGLIYSPHETARLELLVPRARYAQRVLSTRRNGDVWLYAACQFGGGTWSVALPDDTATLVTYSDLRAVLGYEWFSSASAASVAEVGYVFARDISAYGVTQFVPNDAVMLQVSTVY